MIKHIPPNVLQIHEGQKAIWVKRPKGVKPHTRLLYDRAEGEARERQRPQSRGRIVHSETALLIGTNIENYSSPL